jgi:hypothetical protein
MKRFNLLTRGGKMRTRKVIALAVSVLFIFNFIAQAAPINALEYTLRAQATSLSTSTIIQSDLAKPAVPITDPSKPAFAAAPVKSSAAGEAKKTAAKLAAARDKAHVNLFYRLKEAFVRTKGTEEEWKAGDITADLAEQEKFSIKQGRSLDREDTVTLFNARNKHAIHIARRNWSFDAGGAAFLRRYSVTLYPDGGVHIKTMYYEEGLTPATDVDYTIIYSGPINVSTEGKKVIVSVNSEFFKLFEGVAGEEYKEWKKAIKNLPVEIRLITSIFPADAVSAKSTETRMSGKSSSAGKLNQDQINAIYKFLDDNSISRDKLNIEQSSLNLANTRVIDITPLQGMPLTWLDLSLTEVANLTPLNGMPLTKLDLFNTRVADLTPLQGMPLTWLDLSFTRVIDVTPLKDMPLAWLYLSSTRVADITALQGMPLAELDLSFTRVIDVTPLKDMPLAWLYLSSTRVADEQIESAFGRPSIDGGLTIFNQDNTEKTYEIPSSRVRSSSAGTLNLDVISTLIRANLDSDADIAFDTSQDLGMLFMNSITSAELIKSNPVLEGEFAKLADNKVVAIDDTTLPEGHVFRQYLRLGTEAHKALEETHGCIIRLLSDLKGKDLTGKKLIIMSHQRTIEDYEKALYMNINKQQVESGLVLSPYIGIAKLLLIANYDIITDIVNALNKDNFYRRMFGKPATIQEISDFIKSGIYELPIPMPLNYQHAEERHRASLAAFIAA